MTLLWCNACDVDAVCMSHPLPFPLYRPGVQATPKDKKATVVIHAKVDQVWCAYSSVSAQLSSGLSGEAVGCQMKQWVVR